VFRTEIKQDGVDVAYTPEFISPELSSRLFEAVLSEAAWHQPTIRVFGREHLVPRLVAWHADDGCTYSYSGQQHPSRPWTPTLEQIRTLVERDHGPQHAVLANLYQDGSHSIAPHADDEDDLDPDAPILMVSLGAVRKFAIKHRATKARHVLHLEDGSLLEMRGLTNAVATHAVPKTKQPVGPRISLTFRRMAAAHA
jgi:alkylated DNA repair dioxygenase AlkB